MEILDFVLKGQWYDQIKRGEKREEYRDTLFWCVRLLNTDKEGYGHFQKACNGDFEDLKREAADSCAEFTKLLKQAIQEGRFDFRRYDLVRFRRGYTNVAMLFKCEGILIGKGNPEWGAPTDKEVFVIKFSEIDDES